MQTELFEKKTNIAPVEPLLFAFSTYVAYPATAVTDKNGVLRIQWTVPVHSELLPHLLDPTRTTIPCRARCWKGFTWGQLGRGAEITIRAKLTTGSRGGEYLDVEYMGVTIISGKPRSGPKLPKSIIKKIEKSCNS